MLSDFLSSNNEQIDLLANSIGNPFYSQGFNQQTIESIDFSVFDSARYEFQNLLQDLDKIAIDSKQQAIKACLYSLISPLAPTALQHQFYQLLQVAKNANYHAISVSWLLEQCYLGNELPTFTVDTTNQLLVILSYLNGDQLAKEQITNQNELSWLLGFEYNSNEEIFAHHQYLIDHNLNNTPIYRLFLYQLNDEQLQALANLMLANEQESHIYNMFASSGMLKFLPIILSIIDTTENHQAIVKAIKISFAELLDQFIEYEVQFDAYHLAQTDLTTFTQQLKASQNHIFETHNQTAHYLNGHDPLRTYSPTEQSGLCKDVLILNNLMHKHNQLLSENNA